MGHYLFGLWPPPETRGRGWALKGDQVQTQNSRASFDPEEKYCTAEREIKDKERLLTQLRWPHADVI